MPSLATTLQGPLGCGSYSVRLVNDGQPILAPRKVTTVLWGRRLDEASMATITIPVAGTDLRACCVGGNRIEALRTEVIISRNGLDVWQGWLLANTIFRRDTITVNATDILGWLDRRVLEQNHTNVNVDMTTIALEYIADAARGDLPFVINASLSGVLASRTVLATEHRFAGEALRDLLETGLDATVVAGVLLLGPETQTCGTLRLRDTDIEGDPEISIDGRQRATRVIVKGGNGIVAIYPPVPPTVCFHAADTVHSDESILDQASADNAAQLLYERLSASFPYYLTVPQGSALLPTAPVHINALIPGAIAQISSRSLCVEIEMAQRLTALDVEVAAGIEQVRPTFEPLGDTEGDA